MLAGTYQQEMAVTSAQVDQQIGERLAAHDVRYTAGRRKVAAALLQAGGPRSASELHAELGDAVPVSSLYRSLAVMTEAGILARHPGRDGDARYELAEWLTGHHHHLVCVACGAVDDVELSPALETQLEQLVGQVAATGAFQVTGHALEIDGRCPTCR